MGRHTPALLGGLFIGVMASLPVVGACCCLWGVCGGMLVAYLQQQSRPDPIETADAVLGGVLAGVIGAIIAGLVLVAMVSMGRTPIEQMMQDAMTESGQLPEEMRQRVLQFVTGRNLVLLIFVVNIPTYAVFSMLGSLLGVAFFRKKTPPQAPPAPQG